MFVNELNKKVCARRAQSPTNLFDWAMPSAAENIKKTSVENERLCKASAETDKLV